MRLEAALALALLPALGGPLPTPADPLPPATALVTRVEGRAAAEAPDGRLVALEPGRVLPADWRLAVPAGAAVALVCSNDRRARLEGVAAGTAERRSLATDADAACAAGEPLLPGTYRALARGDRDLAVERSRDVRLRVLQVRTRGSEEDDPRVPVLLAPRETSVTEPRPEIRWTRVAAAEEYVLELVGPDAWSERLRAGEVPCRLEPRPPGEAEVCATPWPADAPDLEPAASYFLTVGARTGIATPARKGESRRVRLLPAGATGLEASLAALAEIGLPRAEEGLRAATLLAAHGLRADAAAALRRSLVEAPSARAYLLQGSLELELALPRAALRSFREAARLADGPDLAAEAEAGTTAARRLLDPTFDGAPAVPRP